MKAELTLVAGYISKWFNDPYRYQENYTTSKLKHNAQVLQKTF